MHCAILGPYTLLASLPKKAYPPNNACLSFKTQLKYHLFQEALSNTPIYLDTTPIPTYFSLSQHLRVVDLSILSPIIFAGKELGRASIDFVFVAIPRNPAQCLKYNKSFWIKK